MIKRNDAFWRKKWSKQITSSSSSPVTTSTYRYRCSNLSWPFLTYPSRYKKKKRKEKQKLSFNRCCFPDPDSVKHRLIWFWLLFFLCNVLLYCTSHHRWGGVGGWVGGGGGGGPFDESWVMTIQSVYQYKSTGVWTGLRPDLKRDEIFPRFHRRAVQ